MDKFLIRKDVYEDLIEKGYGKRDLSKLTKKQITDKNGHKRTVYVRNGEQPAVQNQGKAQDELSPEKKVRYEEMLEKVKAGSDENALFVRSKGMLNKKDAIAYLSEKLGKKPVNSAYEGHLESDNPPNTDITKEDEERFGKQALSGLSGERKSDKQTIDNFLYGNEPTPGSIMKQKQQKIMKENDNKVIIKRKFGMISLYGAKTGDHIADFATEKARLDFMKENNLSKPDDNSATSDVKGGEKTVERYKDLYESGNKKPSQDDMKENYLDARNEAGKDIAEDNKIKKLSDKIEFSPEEMKMIRETAAEIGYKVGRNEGKLLNAIYAKDKAMYSALTKKNQKVWDESGKTQKTFSTVDLLKEKIQSMNGDFGADNSDSKFDEEIDDTNKVSFEDSVKEYNFTDTKENQFAMNEVANFYPELKDIVENRRKAFYEVDAAEKKLKVNPNNKEYKDNFASAYNKLKQADEEYDKASKKALEKAPNIKKPDFSKYMDAKRDVQKFLDKYKQQSEEYEVGQRLRNNGGAAILSPMYGLKPDDYTKDPNYIKAQMIIRAYEEK